MIARAKTNKLSSVPDSAEKKLDSLIKELSAYYVERKELIELIFTGLISGHHCFFGGFPGTGKTHLVRTISQHISKSYGYLLFGAETNADQILGSVDPVALMHDKQFKRNTQNGLLEKQIFCADECFKSNSPALNLQLGILNGDEPSKLELYIGLSNELPKDKSLAAFWDRLALRYWIDSRVSTKSRKELMMRTATANNPKITTTLTELEIEELRDKADAVIVPESVIDLILDLIDVLKAKHGIDVSERKSNQVIPILKAYAVVCGDDEVSKKHLSILNHVLWDSIKQRDVIKSEIKELKSADKKGLLEIAKHLDEAIEASRAIPDHAVEKKRRFLESEISYLTDALNKLGSFPESSERNNLLTRTKTLLAEAIIHLAETLPF